MVFDKKEKECLFRLKENLKSMHVISDNHFFYERMIDREPIRRVYRDLGFESQDEMMVHFWNAVIGEDDFVLHLGDFAWRDSSEKMMEELLDRLNGKIFIIVGNHDRELYEIYRRHIECVFGGGVIYIDEGDRFREIDSGFKRVNGVFLSIYGVRILLSHYPVFTNRSADEARTKRLKEIALNYGISVNIFGHIHSLKFPEFMHGVKMVNMSMENTRFVPFKAEDIL